MILCPLLQLFIKHFFHFRDNDVVHDPDVKKTVVDQTKQWSDMMGKHRTEEWELRR